MTNQKKKLSQEILLQGVKVHNLKEISLTLQKRQLILFTGVSGSGKSSLAFDTLYAEGQRAYVESLSLHARRRMEQMAKADVTLIEGMTPSIAIDQKKEGRSPRSTVGTISGIYDFLRLLYARIGTPFCPVSHEAVQPLSESEIIEKIATSFPDRTKIILFAPCFKGKKGENKELFSDLARLGYTRVRLDGRIIDLSDEPDINPDEPHDIDYIIDRMELSKENLGRLTEGVKRALELGKGNLSVQHHSSKEEISLSEHGYSPSSGLFYPKLEPHDFSFNHPKGACPSCQGLGTDLQFIEEKVIDPEKSISQDCCLVASSAQTVRYGNIYANLAKIYRFSLSTPWKKLSREAKQVFLYGSEKKWLRMEFVHPETKKRWEEFVSWKGALNEAKERFLAAKSEFYKAKYRVYLKEGLCQQCQGARIGAFAAATQLYGKKIAEITAQPIEDSLSFFQKLTLTPKEALIGEEIVKEIIERLKLLEQVGLPYLSLDRISTTLSGGEMQRIRLASQIGSGLVDTTYILDEPSIGLHPTDNKKLIATLQALRDKGNTVIVVEHDAETIREADHIVDIGPFAGEKGGQILFQGSYEELLQAKNSLTADYLSGRKKIAIPKQRRKGAKEKITIVEPSHHNLREKRIDIPLGMLVAITGISGSGKSSLIMEILYPALSNLINKSSLPVGKHKEITGANQIEKIIAIDQSSIGRTPRSNPATYTKVFDEIRDLFSALPESRALGFSPGRFSFNVKEGSCPHCNGMGMVSIDMDFLVEEWSSCPQCTGKRFDEQTLSVHYKGKTIHDILEMTILDASQFFQAIPSIKRKLDVLLQVGLEYLRLGHPSPLLSGGEAQRIKLAKELSRPSHGKSLYILDEPTTGLHFYDMDKLLQILQELVNKGNSVVVIEHNMDLVKAADWIIDLGPQGGSGGGLVVAQGTPEAVAKQKSATSLALQEALFPVPLPEKQKKREQEQHYSITIRGAKQNNLKNLSLSIPRGKITICTGPSGSGKSSLAIDTLYAEGKRRYEETLSSYARQFIKPTAKPLFDEIEGLSPAIAIEQKIHAGNPRSTVGTLTEVYDYLRILYSYLGTAYCPETGEKIESITKEYAADKLLSLEEGTRLHILSPISLPKNSTFEEWKELWQKRGFLRLRLNNSYYELDDAIPYDKQKKNSLFLVIDRLIVKQQSRSRLLEAIEKAADLSKGEFVAALEAKDLFFNLSFAVVKTGKSYPPLTPHSFSFNTQEGMCPECLGLGVEYGIDLLHKKEWSRLTPLQLIQELWKDYTSPPALQLFTAFLKEQKIDPQTPLYQLSEKQISTLLFGSTSSPSLYAFRGIQPVLAKLAKESSTAIRESLLPILQTSDCPSCKGSRLNPLARNVRLQNLTLPELTALPIKEAYHFLLSVKKSPSFLEEPLRQARERLRFLLQIGLDYLSINRSAPTLSSGEHQRIRLARQLGSGLTGCLYILDEPTTGLHPVDISQLNQALLNLKEIGNTLLLVEHDPETIAIADRIIDFGPLAGKAGGQITAQGTVEEIKNNPHSLTGSYLSGKKSLSIPQKRRKAKNHIHIRNASLHNLKNLNLQFPLGAISCITGPSGCGKSTLLTDLIQPAVERALNARPAKESVELFDCRFSGLDKINKLVVLDQNPIGHTIRADVSTYTELLAPLRHLFASLPEAKIRGLEARHFSFNHPKGMCRSCWGIGKRSFSMQFLPPVQIPCDACSGFRLNPLSLQVTFKGKHLGEILHLTVEQARHFLEAIPAAVKILDTLISVGLDYLRLDQEMVSLSGGESQRIRLTRELAKRSTGKTLYLLDEPTRGLHSEDLAKLLPIFHRLAEQGNSLIIVEHNLDLIANADYVFDLGPKAGAEGGYLTASGTPEEVAQDPSSLTGSYLKKLLQKENKSGRTKKTKS